MLTLSQGLEGNPANLGGVMQPNRGGRGVYETGPSRITTWGSVRNRTPHRGVCLNIHNTKGELRFEKEREQTRKGRREGGEAHEDHRHPRFRGEGFPRSLRGLCGGNDPA